MFKKLLFISFIAVSFLTSCEEPVHEEYNMYDDNADNPNTSATWFPLATNNKWVMKQVDNGTENIIDNQIINTEVISGVTYYKTSEKIYENGTLTSESSNHMRWNGNVLDVRASSLAGAEMLEEMGLTGTPFVMHPLKNNMNVGDTWSETITATFTGIIDLTVVYNFTYTYVEHLNTMTVNGVVYNDIANVKTDVSLTNPLLPSETITGTSHSFYAKNIGAIKRYDIQDGVTSSPFELTSYVVN